MSGNFKKIFDDFFQFFPVVTGVDRALQGFSGGYKGLHCVTVGYEGYRVFERITENLFSN